MNYLITGGAGFIGSNLAEELIIKDNQANITIIDNLSTGKTENIPPDKRINFIKCDVCSSNFINEICRLNNPDYIFHLAAVSSVQESFTNPIYANEVNLLSFIKMLELCRRMPNLKRIVFTSSAAVYGDPVNIPSSEKNAVNPISPYGIDKNAAENYAMIYNSLFGIPVTVFRLFNVFGPRQNPASQYSGVISIFQKAFTNENPEITIYGDGRQTRDFIFVKDIVKILINTLDNEETAGKIINAAGGNETSLVSVIKIFEEITQKKASITFKEKRHGDINRSCGDNSLIRKYSLIKDFTSIKDGLKQFINESPVKNQQGTPPY